MYNVTTLENGLKVASFTKHKIRSVAMGVWIGAGGRHESEHLSGVSHFIEHLVFKGTKNRNFRQIKEEIEGTGGVLNAFTSEELTCYLAKVLDSNKRQALDVLFDISLNPLLKKNDIDKEKLVIFEEIRMYYDLPHHLVYDEMIKLLWPNNPLGRNLAGNFKTLNSIKRNDLIEYKNKHYIFNNMLICCAGNIEHDELVLNIKSVLKKDWSSFKSEKKINFEKVSVSQKKPQFKFISKNTEQMHISLGFHAFEREHPLKYALILLHVILGANMSSRLFNEVREKRSLAYEISTGIKLFDDTGCFVISSGIVNEKLEVAMTIIQKELNRISRKKPAEDELKRAKDYYIGHLLMGLEDMMDHMFWIGEGIMVKSKLETVADVVKKVKQVQPKDIVKAAEIIFKKEGLNCAIVGPLDNAREKEAARILNSF
ncbi:MAG: insulinase family protein [Candidatus Omnitrophica bacterium]|nr:insulinase family protein [Candidatus Omnitrophota bacterium]